MISSSRGESLVAVRRRHEESHGFAVITDLGLGIVHPVEISIRFAVQVQVVSGVKELIGLSVQFKARAVDTVRVPSYRRAVAAKIQIIILKVRMA